MQASKKFCVTLSRREKKSNWSAAVVHYISACNLGARVMFWHLVNRNDSEGASNSLDRARHALHSSFLAYLLLRISVGVGLIAVGILSAIL